jgi:hypothetical protein
LNSTITILTNQIQLLFGWVFAGKNPVNKGGRSYDFLKSEIDE